MKRSTINTVLVAGALLVVMFTIGCGEKKTVMGVNNVPVVQNCTVSTQDSNLVVTCPDGTSITLPANVIVNNTETIVEVPVIVAVPVKCKEHHNHGHHNENDDDDSHNDNENED